MARVFLPRSCHLQVLRLQVCQGPQLPHNLTSPPTTHHSPTSLSPPSPNGRARRPRQPGAPPAYATPACVDGRRCAVGAPKTPSRTRTEPHKDGRQQDSPRTAGGGPILRQKRPPNGCLKTRMHCGAPLRFSHKRRKMRNRRRKDVSEQCSGRRRRRPRMHARGARRAHRLSPGAPCGATVPTGTVPTAHTTEYAAHVRRRVARNTVDEPPIYGRRT